MNEQEIEVKHNFLYFLSFPKSLGLRVALSFGPDGFGSTRSGQPFTRYHLGNFSTFYSNDS